jgi:hypothetical protein
MFMLLTPLVCWPNADTLVCQLALRHRMFAIDGHEPAAHNITRRSARA